MSLTTALDARLDVVRALVVPTWEALSGDERRRRADEMSGVLYNVIENALATYNDEEWSAFTELLRAYMGVPGSSLSFHNARAQLVIICANQKQRLVRPRRRKDPP